MNVIIVHILLPRVDYSCWRLSVANFQSQFTSAVCNFLFLFFSSFSSHTSGFLLPSSHLFLYSLRLFQLHLLGSIENLLICLKDKDIQYEALENEKQAGSFYGRVRTLAFIQVYWETIGHLKQGQGLIYITKITGCCRNTRTEIVSRLIKQSRQEMMMAWPSGVPAEML